MAVTPTGLLSVPLNLVRTMISESSTFQTEVGAINAAAALEFIHLVREEDPDQDAYAVVTYGDYQRERDSGGAINYYTPNGTVHVELVRLVADDEVTTYADGVIAFYNFMGALQVDIEAISGSGGYPNITGFSWQEARRSIERLKDRTTTTRDEVAAWCEITYARPS